MFGWSIALVSSARCLSAVLPRGVVYGGTSFAGWCSESTPGAALCRADWWIWRGFEDCFEAEDANVRRSAACWVVGRAAGSAAMRKQRVQIFFEAMIHLILALGAVVYVRLYSSGSNGRLEMPEGDGQPALSWGEGSRSEMDDGQALPQLPASSSQDSQAFRPRRVEDRVKITAAHSSIVHCQQHHLLTFRGKGKHQAPRGFYIQARSATARRICKSAGKVYGTYKSDTTSALPSILGPSIRSDSKCTLG